MDLEADLLETSKAVYLHDLDRLTEDHCGRVRAVHFQCLRRIEVIAPELFQTEYDSFTGPLHVDDYRELKIQQGELQRKYEERDQAIREWIERQPAD